MVLTVKYCLLIGLSFYCLSMTILLMFLVHLIISLIKLTLLTLDGFIINS